jgi:capsular polysaccharide transport system permease protein
VFAASAERRRNPVGERYTIAPVTPLSERGRIEEMPLLPQRARKRSHGTLFSFLLCVVVPLALASIYYVGYASDQYVSEFRFAVREASTPSISPMPSGMASLVGAAASSSFAENFMVTDYLTSRQIVDELQTKINVKTLYSRPFIDWWSLFDPTWQTEKFVRYWKNMVSANYDQITGVAVAEVRAFTPDDAFLIATTMVSLAEKLVNDVAMRPRRDAVGYAENEVKRAEDRLKNIRAQMTDYRDKESVIDPNSNVVASNTTLAQTLRSTLVQYETELASLTRQNLRGDAPSVLALKSRIYAAKQQLAQVEAQVAHAQGGGGSRSLSRVVGQYEQLDLERQTAQTLLTSAIQSLEQARLNAMVQPLYITPFVRPARPESPIYPNRFVAILTVGFACFFLWTIGLLVIRSIREHLA